MMTRIHLSLVCAMLFVVGAILPSVPAAIAVTEVGGCHGNAQMQDHSGASSDHADKSTESAPAIPVSVLSECTMQHHGVLHAARGVVSTQIILLYTIDDFAEGFGFAPGLHGVWLHAPLWVYWPSVGTSTPRKRLTQEFKHILI